LGRPGTPGRRHPAGGHVAAAARRFRAPSGRLTAPTSGVRSRTSGASFGANGTVPRIGCEVRLTGIRSGRVRTGATVQPPFGHRYGLTCTGTRLRGPEIDVRRAP